MEPNETFKDNDAHLPDEQINKGANDQSQLERLNENVTDEERDGYPDNQIGTPPSTGDENLEASKDSTLSGGHLTETRKGYDQKSGGDVGQFTPTTGGSDADLEENMGGTTNLSLDQLEQEGDVNNPDE